MNITRPGFSDGRNIAGTGRGDLPVYARVIIFTSRFRKKPPDQAVPEGFLPELMQQGAVTDRTAVTDASGEIRQMIRYSGPWLFGKGMLVLTRGSDTGVARQHRLIPGSCTG